MPDQDGRDKFFKMIEQMRYVEERSVLLQDGGFYLDNPDATLQGYSQLHLRYYQEGKPEIILFLTNEQAIELKERIEDRLIPNLYDPGVFMEDVFSILNAWNIKTKEA